MTLKELDLHGMNHDWARKVVISWTKENLPPYKIITGNSNGMERIVKEVLGKKYDLSYESEYNLGALIVTPR
jgi:hypothetical protein